MSFVLMQNMCQNIQQLRVGKCAAKMTENAKKYFMQKIVRKKNHCTTTQKNKMQLLLTNFNIAKMHKLRNKIGLKKQSPADMLISE